MLWCKAKLGEEGLLERALAREVVHREDGRNRGECGLCGEEHGECAAGPAK